jgi:hypothetical protein
MPFTVFQSILAYVIRSVFSIRSSVNFCSELTDQCGNGEEINLNMKFVATYLVHKFFR